MNRLKKRFVHPFNGLIFILTKDRNLLLHLIFAFIVIVFSLLLKLNTSEWLWILFAIFSVIITEVINTAIEYTIDLITKDYNELAKKAKDSAALAVLLSSIMAALIGLIIFLPKIINIL